MHMIYVPTTVGESNFKGSVREKKREKPSGQINVL